MGSPKHELTHFVIDYLEKKYPKEFQEYGAGDHDGVYFVKGQGLTRFFITIDTRSINFFQPTEADYEVNIDAADPKLFKYIDKYAKLYRNFEAAR